MINSKNIALEAPPISHLGGQTRKLADKRVPRVSLGILVFSNRFKTCSGSTSISQNFPLFEGMDPAAIRVGGRR